MNDWQLEVAGGKKSFTVKDYTKGNRRVSYFILSPVFSGEGLAL